MTSVQGGAGTIYSLTCSCHPDSGIRYVGQTVRKMSDRLRDHRGMARYRREHGMTLSHVQNWILKHGAQNVLITALETDIPISELNKRERFWIKKARSHGADLANVGDGGDAVWRGGKRPDFAEKMRGSGNPMYGVSRAEIMAHARSFQDRASVMKALRANPPRGERSRASKLKESDIPVIRSRALETSLSQLAREYGVTAQSIWSIVHRKTWMHIA